MVQVKKKEEELSKAFSKSLNKKLRSFLTSKKRGRVEISDTINGLQIWEEEAKELKTMNFSNIEEAFNALIDRVTAKLKIPEKSEHETRRFLMDLFDTDPVIKEELRGILRIK